MGGIITNVKTVPRDAVEPEVFSGVVQRTQSAQIMMAMTLKEGMGLQGSPNAFMASRTVDDLDVQFFGRPLDQVLKSGRNGSHRRSIVGISEHDANLLQVSPGC